MSLRWSGFAGLNFEGTGRADRLIALGAQHSLKSHGDAGTGTTMDIRPSAAAVIPLQGIRVSATGAAAHLPGRRCTDKVAFAAATDGTASRGHCSRQPGWSTRAEIRAARDNARRPGAGGRGRAWMDEVRGSRAPSTAQAASPRSWPLPRKLKTEGGEPESVREGGERNQGQGRAGATVMARWPRIWRDERMREFLRQSRRGGRASERAKVSRTDSLHASR